MVQCPHGETQGALWSRFLGPKRDILHSFELPAPPVSHRNPLVQVDFIFVELFGDSLSLCLLLSSPPVGPACIIPKFLLCVHWSPLAL